MNTITSITNKKILSYFLAMTMVMTQGIPSGWTALAPEDYAAEESSVPVIDPSASPSPTPTSSPVDPHTDFYNSSPISSVSPAPTASSSPTPVPTVSPTASPVPLPSASPVEPETSEDPEPEAAPAVEEAPADPALAPAPEAEAAEDPAPDALAPEGEAPADDPLAAAAPPPDEAADDAKDGDVTKDGDDPKDGGGGSGTKSVSLIANGDFEQNDTGTPFPNGWINFKPDGTLPTYLETFDGHTGVMDLSVGGLKQVLEPPEVLSAEDTCEITFRIDYASLPGDGWYGNESPITLIVVFQRPDGSTYQRKKFFNYTHDGDSAGNPKFFLVPRYEWVTHTFTMADFDISEGDSLAEVTVKGTGWDRVSYLDAVYWYSNDDHVVDVWPGESIQEAIDGAQAGDTILIHAGTYEESLVIDKELHLQGEGPEETVILGSDGSSTVVDFIPEDSDSDISVSGLSLQIDGNAIYFSGGRYASVEDVWTTGIYAGHMTSLSVSNSLFDGTGNSGADFGILAIDVADISITDNTLQSFFHGIMAERFERAVIARNTIHSLPTNEQGVHISDIGESAQIYHNTIWGYSIGVSLGAESSIYEDLDKLRIFNNIFSLHRSTGEELDQVGLIYYDGNETQPPGEGFYFDYNLYTGFELPEWYFANFPWPEALGDHNLVDVDPRFLDETTSDFGLRADSPVVDAGDPQSPLDPDGTRADMGAIAFDHNLSSINITFDGVQAELEFGTDMTVTATTDPPEVDSYQWYLDGVLLEGETSDTITIGSALAIRQAPYRLTVEVSIDGATETESVDFMVLHPVPAGWRRTASNPRFAMYKEVISLVVYAQFKLHLKDLVTGEETVLANFDNHDGSYLSGKFDVSPNGTTVVYAVRRYTQSGLNWTTKIRNIKTGSTRTEYENAEPTSFQFNDDDTVSIFYGATEIVRDIWPIDITFSGVRDEIVEGAEMTVTAATDPESIDTFRWYLDGVLMEGETGPEITIGSGLLERPKPYELTLEITVRDITHSETVEFIVWRGIEVTFTGVEGVLPFGEDMTVTASTEPRPADTYQWYLDGVLLAGETGPEVTIGSGLATRTEPPYELSVALTLDDMAAIESVSFVVQYEVPAGWERTESNPDFAFHRNVEGESPDRVHILELMDLNSGETQELARVNEPGTIPADSPVDVSPGGEIVIYSTADANVYTTYIQSVSDPASQMTLGEAKLQSIIFNGDGTVNLETRGAYDGGLVIEHSYKVDPAAQTVVGPESTIVSAGGTLHVDEDTPLVIHSFNNSWRIYDVSEGLDHLNLLWSTPYWNMPGVTRTLIDAYTTSTGRQVVSLGTRTGMNNSNIILDPWTGESISFGGMLHSDCPFGAFEEVVYDGDTAIYAGVTESGDTSHITVNLNTFEFRVDPAGDWTVAPSNPDFAFRISGPIPVLGDVTVLSYGLILMDLRTGNMTGLGEVLYQEQVSDPFGAYDVSPDGTAVIYIAEEWEGGAEGDAFEIHVRRLDNPEEELLLEGKPLSIAFQNNLVTIEAQLRLPEGGVTQTTYLIDLDTLTVLPGEIYQSVLSYYGGALPDGAFIASIEEIALNYWEVEITLNDSQETGVIQNHLLKVSKANDLVYVSWAYFRDFEGKVMEEYQYGYEGVLIRSKVNTYYPESDQIATQREERYYSGRLYYSYDRWYEEDGTYQRMVYTYYYANGDAYLTNDIYYTAGKPTRRYYRCYDSNGDLIRRIDYYYYADSYQVRLLYRYDYEAGELVGRTTSYYYANGRLQLYYSYQYENGELVRREYQSYRDTGILSLKYEMLYEAGQIASAHYEFYREDGSMSMQYDNTYTAGQITGVHYWFYRADETVSMEYTTSYSQGQITYNHYKFFREDGVTLNYEYETYYSDGRVIQRYYHYYDEDNNLIRDRVYYYHPNGRLHISVEINYVGRHYDDAFYRRYSDTGTLLQYISSTYHPNDRIAVMDDYNYERGIHYHYEYDAQGNLLVYEEYEI